MISKENIICLKKAPGFFQAVSAKKLRLTYRSGVTRASDKLLSLSNRDSPETILETVSKYKHGLRSDNAPLFLHLSQ